MHTPKNRHWFALVIAFALAAPLARGSLITPDSIPNPPSAVGSANGSPVAMNNLVTTQYTGLGFTFFNGGTALTSLNGIAVWAPVQPLGIAIKDPFPPPNLPWGKINYYTPWYGGNINSLATRNPMTVSSLTVTTIGNPGSLSLAVFGRNPQPLNITPLVQSIPGSNGEETWTFTGSGIYGFTASEAVIDAPGLGKMPVNPAWGVAAISFTPSIGQSPEPSSLVLAALGALGLAGRFRRRR